MSITEWKVSPTPRRNYTPIQSIAHLLMLERHAPEKDIYDRDILEYFSVSDFSEQRKTNTWQQRDGLAFRRAMSRQRLPRLTKWNNWGRSWKGKLLDENFFDKQDKLLHVSGLFFFPQDELYAAAPAGESERSGHRAAVSHPEEQLDGLPDKAQHTKLCAPHSRPSNIPAIVGIGTCGFLQ